MFPPRLPRPLALVALGLLTACGLAPPRFGSLTSDARGIQLKVAVQMVELTNGMTIALAPDPRTNLVSVDMRYTVGAAEDPAGRAGLAHLLEHLTFQAASGTQGATIFDQATALSLSFNAYTNADVTHYTAIALADRVDALLELEAQRLEQRCDQIADAAFVRERDVVLEEDAQRQTPVSAVALAIAARVWGPDHPYARPVGSRAVATATKAEACAFFDAYYVPKRAILVVSGNFDPETVRARIGSRFGPIARAATGTSTPIAPPRLDGTRSEHTADVDHPIALVYLPAPAWGADDEALHDGLLAALSGELYELDDQADWLVSATVGYAGTGRQRVTEIALVVTDPDRLDAAVDAALARGRALLEDHDRDGHYDDDDDPDDRVVARQLTALLGRQLTATVAQADRFWGHGDSLADYLTYTTHYAFMLDRLRWIDAITASAIAERGQRLFNRDRAHVALIRPSGDATAAARTVVASSAKEYDLPSWRVAVDPAEAARPAPMPRGAKPIAIDDYRLTNGLRVLMFVDPSSPITDVRLVYPVGKNDDDPDHPGVATFAGALLDHDYDREYPGSTYDTVNWALGLGTQLGADVDDDVTVFSARGLAVFGDWHTWRLSWLLDQGTYPGQVVAAVRRDLREVGDGDLSPSGVAFYERLYGRGHPYAAKPATVAQLTSIGGGRLAAWRRAHYATDGATLIITGGFDRAAMRRAVGELFGAWTKTTPTLRRSVPAPRPAPGPSWLGVRIPTATQVKLYVSFTARSDVDRDRAARLVLAALISDRLRIIREGMGASYGVAAGYQGTGDAALAITTALDPVRAPKAAVAILAELAAVRADVTGLAADFARARRQVLGRLLATSTDATTIADRLEAMVTTGGELTELQGLASAVATLTPAAVAAVAKIDLDPTRMVVSVDGRVEPVTATLTSLGASDLIWFDE